MANVFIHTDGENVVLRGDYVDAKSLVKKTLKMFDLLP